MEVVDAANSLLGFVNSCLGSSKIKIQKSKTGSPRFLTFEFLLFNYFNDSTAVA